jgi:hypothetical protein
MRKHINDTIWKKNARRKERHAGVRAKRESNLHEMFGEFEVTHEKSSQQLNLIHQITLATCQIKAWAIMDGYFEDDKRNKENGSKAIGMFEEKGCDKTWLPYSWVNTNQFKDWTIQNKIDE